METTNIMIVALATHENNLNATIDPYFGRCDWYCLYDTETHQNSFVENPVRNHQEQTGCDAAKILLGENISMAIAGRFGSKVEGEFRRNNIQMVIPETEQTLSEIINQIKK